MIEDKEGEEETKKGQGNPRKEGRAGQLGEVQREVEREAEALHLREGWQEGGTRAQEGLASPGRSLGLLGADRGLRGSEERDR